MIRDRKFSPSKRQMQGDVLNYVGYGLILIFFGLPLVWLLSLALRSPQEIWEISVNLIPRNPTLDNFWVVFQDGKVRTYLFNSFKLVGLGTFVAFIGAAPAAYAMSRFRFQHANRILIGVLALQMISPVVIMIPLYRLLASARLVDSPWVTGLLYGALLMPFMTWVLKGFFDQIPTDLDEAALIDGCTRWQAFVRAVLPVAQPGVISALVLAVVVGWGQFAVPYILLKRNADLPFSVGILALQNQQQYTQSPLGLLAASTIIGMAPIIILFLVLQPLVVRGMIQGAVKG